jgi:hypothetical protein
MTPQHLSALALANEIRYAQAAWMRSLRALPPAQACRRAAHALWNPDENVGSIRLERVLRSVPRMGDRYVDLLLTQAGVPIARRKRRVRELTERERRIIAAALIARAKRSKASGSTRLSSPDDDAHSSHGASSERQGRDSRRVLEEAA